MFVGVLFILSCIFGVFIAIFPGRLKRFISYGDIEKNDRKTEASIRELLGHHPDCDGFHAHRIWLFGQHRCAGCMGLFFGAILAIILAIIYILSNSEFSSTSAISIFFGGLILISLIIAEIIISKRNAKIHMISNILLVLGFLMVTVSTLEITGIRGVGLISILLSFLWLDTRIQLANWKHKAICSKCERSCSMY